VKFDPIIKAIDKMVAQLKEEEDNDLETKQTCEKDRMDNTRKAIVLSRTIDEHTDAINKLTASIEEAENTIKNLQAENKKTQDELAKATQMRDDENKAWKKTDEDDKAASETVVRATDVLKEWYAENQAFIQTRQPVEGMAAGEAPPPPPPTWEGGYEGKQGESQGIVAIMEMVNEDIVKDRADAKADEDNAQKEFDAFKKDSEDHIAALKKQEEDTDKKMGDDMDSRSQETKERGTAKQNLDEMLKTIKGINPNCEYYEVNYPMRRKNRQIELDGLQKAKAILEGGVFNAGPDPDREMKPGDAFLQKRI